MKVQKQIDELRSLRAAEWFQVMQQDPSEAESAAFVAWLEESRAHIQEYLEISAVDKALGQVSAGMRAELLGETAPLTPPVTLLPARVRPGVFPRASRRGKWVMGAGLCASVLLATGIWMASLWHAGREYTTEVGEQRTIALTDASVITLNVASRIEVTLNDTAREVELHRGEALFTVARDQARPFRVHTPAGTVQVLGTQFNVYAKADGSTHVSVLEGRVRLTSGNVTETLDAGEEAVLRPAGAIERNLRPAVQNTVAWRDRQLVFHDVPLEDMILEFNRYSAAQPLKLEGIPGNTYRYAGVFNADDPTSLVAILKRDASLSVERREGYTVIRPRGR